MVTVGVSRVSRVSHCFGKRSCTYRFPFPCVYGNAGNGSGAVSNGNRNDNQKTKVFPRETETVNHD